MNIYSAGFFGLVAIACVSVFKSYYASDYKDESTGYIINTDLSELERNLDFSIEHNISFVSAFGSAASTPKKDVIIYKKCGKVHYSQTKECEHRLQNLFDVITIERLHPGWRGVCNDYHDDTPDIYECIRNFKRNTAWFPSTKISDDRNEEIRECFRKTNKSELSKCV
ncbi:hypothetical protein [Enterovibrio norvegicus]|uniref:Uncharacterized protein n=1 Tax=Enterovibrio norvegicus TaxID=188144 RepID=A0A2N7L3J2_9GAMM|nr:hypothetical protein [Enterovibrio norvegicus]PMN87509.1 hypothetical protein BCT23_09140 [Enterovibrio norvegicus]